VLGRTELIPENPTRTRDVWSVLKVRFDGPVLPWTRQLMCGRVEGCCGQVSSTAEVFDPEAAGVELRQRRVERGCFRNLVKVKAACTQGGAFARRTTGQDQLGPLSKTGRCAGRTLLVGPCAERGPRQLTRNAACEQLAAARA
jgi:hypothetical protein